jgi:hypothetical protein
MICGQCGSNFTKRKERKTVKYICSKYHNSGECIRIPIEEKLMVDLISNRFQRELSDEEIRDVVVEIVIKNELHFDIILSEGAPISFHEHGIVF